MIQHTSREFSLELKSLQQRLLAMAERGAEQILLAMKALIDQNDELAHQVVRAHAAIDSTEIEIDQMVMQILATRQPVASDLRFVTMSLKFVVDVRRIGELAAGIAKRALELNRLPMLESRVDLTQLATMVQRNLYLAIDSFVKRDVEQASVVIRGDVEIDRLNASLFAQLVAHVAADPATVTRVLPLTSVCRYLERIGDHVKSLAEQVIFMVEATDVRHQSAAQ